LQPNSVTWSKDGKHFQLPYTYDNDKINFQGEPYEVEKMSEYRRKNNTPIEGTQSPMAINLQGIEVMTTQQLTPEQQTKLTTNAVKQLMETYKLTENSARQVVANAMHQGAHQLIHDATQHMDTHQPQGANHSDSQARTAAGGARTESINKMIGSGKYKEEDRKFLEGMPDDHFASISGDAIKGATETIVPYTYQGIGDRSNVHTANRGGAQQMTEEQYIATLPPRLQGILSNAIATEQQERDSLISAICMNKAAGYNPEFLKGLNTDMLRGMCRLMPQAPPVQNAEGHQQLGQRMPNYGGQASVPMFVDPVQVTRNGQTMNAGAEQQQQSFVLPLPSMSFDNENAA
jgi:hypothetical protein